MNGKSFFLSLWAYWLFVTLADVVTLYGAGNEGRWNHIPNAVFNFFTPILIGNLDLNRPVIFALLLGGLLIGDLLSRAIPWATVRVVFNLILLAGLTGWIDSIVQGSWMSLDRLRLALHF